MDSALLNKYVTHLAQGHSLSWEIKTLNSVVHSVGNSHANFSCNQSRAYTKLDTMFVNYIRTEAAASTPSGTRKHVNWFQGISSAATDEVNDTTDTLEAYITIGSTRVPLFAETKLNQHFYRLLQATGKMQVTFIHYLCRFTHTGKTNSATDLT